MSNLDRSRSIQETDASRWTSSAFDVYERSRLVFREGNAKVVNEVLSEHLSGTDRVLELGCGMGELCRLAPGYVNQIQQTDGSSQIVSEHKERHRNSNIVFASAYDLPFKDREFDQLVGYSSFDVLSDIDTATSEMARVIRPGGKVIHFLDLQASLHPIFNSHREEGKVLFPHSELVDGFLTLTGLQSVSRLDYDRAKSGLHEGLIPSYDSYANNPEGQFLFLHSHPELSALLTYLGHDVAKMPIPRTVIRVNDLFLERLGKSLQEAGLTVIENGMREGRVERARDEVPFATEGKNLVINNVGSAIAIRDGSLGLQPGKVMTVSRLLVTIAQKPDS